jgi:hypothetical protein
VNAAVAAMIAAVTSVVVTGLSLLLGDRQQRRREERSQRQDLNARYLNPLRFHLVENHYRLADTLQRVDAGGGKWDGMLTISDPAEISGKDAEWFNGVGCALASWLYLIACLFAQLKKVRDDFPYLRLAAADDTRLAALLLGVQQGYLLDQGIYYVTQPSIGQSMWVQDQDRLLTYREPCPPAPRSSSSRQSHNGQSLYQPAIPDGCGSFEVRGQAPSVYWPWVVPG